MQLTCSATVGSSEPNFTLFCLCFNLEWCFWLASNFTSSFFNHFCALSSFFVSFCFVCLFLPVFERLNDQFLPEPPTPHPVDLSADSLLTSDIYWIFSLTVEWHNQTWLPNITHLIWWAIFTIDLISDLISQTLPHSSSIKRPNIAVIFLQQLCKGRTDATHSHRQ